MRDTSIFQVPQYVAPIRRVRPWRVTHGLRLGLAVWLCLFLCSCQTSDDAKAAASQLATTATQLENYYGELIQIVTADIALGDLQNNILPHGTVLPFPDANRALLKTTLSDLQKRANMAKGLAGLSTAFSSLTGSTAASDVDTAASNLATELTNLNAVPKAVGPVPIPATIGGASKLLLSWIQQRDEKKAAPALDATVSGFKDLFSAEVDVYNSLNVTYLAEASGLAKYCVERNLVDESSLLTPALQPFGLTPRVPPNLDPKVVDPKLLIAAAENQVDQSTSSLTTASQNASAAMLQAITQMSTRVHQLAVGGKMSSRDTPISLSTVENWVNAADSYLSNTATAAASVSAKSSVTSSASTQKAKK